MLSDRGGGGGEGGEGEKDPKWWNTAPMGGWVGVMYRNQLRSLDFKW